jgi:AcrR family transcriptional regulator
MSQTGTGVYGGVSAEDRRAERRARLMAAGLELIGTEGWANTTVRGVCRQAQLSSRFFYESFPDVDALAVALFDELVHEATTAAFKAIALVPQTPTATARAAIATLVEEFTKDPRKARFAFMEAMGSEPLMQRRLGIMRTTADLLATMARQSYPSLPADDTYVDVVASVLAGGFVELMISFVGGQLSISKDQLVDDFVTMMVSSAENAPAIARQRSLAP